MSNPQPGRRARARELPDGDALAVLRRVYAAHFAEVRRLEAQRLGVARRTARPGPERPA